MKTITIILLLTLCNLSQAQTTGYLIFVAAEQQKPRVHKVCKAAVADSIISRYSNKCFIGFSTKKALKNSNFIELRTETIQIYIERKIIVTKKNGRVKFKRAR